MKTPVLGSNRLKTEGCAGERPYAALAIALSCLCSPCWADSLVGRPHSPNAAGYAQIAGRHGLASDGYREQASAVLWVESVHGIGEACRVPPIATRECITRAPDNRNEGSYFRTNIRANVTHQLWSDNDSGRPDEILSRKDGFLIRKGTERNSLLSVADPFLLNKEPIAVVRIAGVQRVDLGENIHLLRGNAVVILHGPKQPDLRARIFKSDWSVVGQADAQPRPLTGVQSLLGNVGLSDGGIRLPPRLTVSTGGVDRSRYRRTSGDDGSRSGHSPVNALVALVTLIAGVLLGVYGLRRASVWPVLGGWGLAVCGGAGVLYAVLWWTVVEGIWLRPVLGLGAVLTAFGLFLWGLCHSQFLIRGGRVVYSLSFLIALICSSMIVLWVGLGLLFSDFAVAAEDGRILGGSSSARPSSVLSPDLAEFPLNSSFPVGNWLTGKPNDTSGTDGGYVVGIFRAAQITLRPLFGRCAWRRPGAIVGLAVQIPSAEIFFRGHRFLGIAFGFIGFALVCWSINPFC